MLRLIFATQFIMTFQPSIILIFSNEIQPIYPISKQEVSMNFDCNFQAIDSRHGCEPVLRKQRYAKSGLATGNATDH